MQVTVVGGGFGGVKAALEIAKHPKNRVTLISDKPDFQYYPALYGTATGRSHLQSWVPLGEIFAGYENVNIIIDSITTIDKAAKTLTGESGEVYTYNTAILALGSVTTYFGIEGLDHYAYGIKSYDEIRRLQQHLLEAYAHPNAADKHYLIIGGGPTGVELGAALGEYLKHLKKRFRQPEPRATISIIEASPRVLPRMSGKASALVEKRLKKLGVHVETNKRVEAETADALIVNGRPVQSHTVIWTSGVANSPFFKNNASQFTLNERGKVTVNAHMQVDPHLYVIGDNAATPFSGLAQTALHDGIFVAKHIMRETNKAYKPKLPPVVVPVGEGWAIFEYKWIRFGGWLGALIRQAADFVGYKDILPFGQALGIWRAQSIKQDPVYFAAKEETK